MTDIDIAIIDYECGNIHSARKAFELALSELEISGKVTVTNDIKTISKSDKLVLPGVGAFNECYKKLMSIEGLSECITNRVFKQNVPILGICVGLQLMADRGFENLETKGLGWISGQVKNLCPEDKKLKIPHMGWNEVYFKKDNNKFYDLSGENFYFVHSYYFDAGDKDNILGLTNYDQPFPSALIKGNIIGTQFHPEKSQRAGVEFIKRFIEWKP